MVIVVFDVCVLVQVLVGALYVTNLGVVYSLIGSIGSCSFALLFPTAMYLKSKAMKRNWVTTALARAVFSFGVVLLLLGVATCLMPASS